MTPPTQPPGVDVEGLRKLCEAATPGPWAADDNCGYPYVYVDDGNEDGDVAGIVEWNEKDGGADARFIAAARTALPALLDEVERLRKQWKERLTPEGQAKYDSLLAHYIGEDGNKLRAQRDAFMSTAREATERLQVAEAEAVRLREDNNNLRAAVGHANDVIFGLEPSDSKAAIERLAKERDEAREEAKRVEKAADGAFRTALSAWTRDLQEARDERDAALIALHGERNELALLRAQDVAIEPPDRALCTLILDMIRSTPVACFGIESNDRGHCTKNKEAAVALLTKILAMANPALAHATSYIIARKGSDPGLWFKMKVRCTCGYESPWGGDEECTHALMAHKVGCT